MNVLNRKMFQRRPARDKLSQMGGIMSSSPELASTVARYSQGGPVAKFRDGNIVGGSVLRGFVPDMSSEQFMASPVEQQRQLIQAEQNRRYLNRVGNKTAMLAGMYSDPIMNTIFGAGNLGIAALKGAGYIDPRSDFELPTARTTGKAIEDYRSNVYMSGADPRLSPELQETTAPSLEGQAQQYAALLATERGEFQDPAIARAVQQQAEVKMPTPSVAEEDVLGFDETDLANTIPRPEAATTETTTETTETTTTTAPVPAGEADKQQVEAADLGAIFDQANTQTSSDPLGTSTGTDLEELKQKIMNLMPQYDEEGSTKRQGLLLAQMGAAIAAGKSGDAIANIADGIQKTLPGFIRESEKREKFKTELEAGAAKIAVTEGFARDRAIAAEERQLAKERRKKQNYFLDADVDMVIGGQKVTGKRGQLVRLNEDQIDRAIAEGIPLTTETALVSQLKLRAKEIENGTGTVAPFYNKKSVTYSPENSYFKGVRYYEPNPQGNQAGLSNMYTTSSLNQIQSTYTNQKNELISSLYLVDAGIQLAPQATGAAGTFGRMRDQFIGVIGEENAKRFGLDPKSLSGASEFDVMQRMMAAKFAPLLLGESGKTISDQDRARVAALLGINLDTGETLPGFFNNPRQVEKALREVKGIILQNNAALDNEYTALLQGSFGPGMQPISVQPMALETPETLDMSNAQMEKYLSAFYK